ncbi:MAG: sodium:calcium antiporter [Streptosporangiaceae bacterium]
MPVAGWLLVLAAAVAVSLAASWLLVSRLERLAERAGFSEAWLGLVAAFAADAPEITSAVTALVRGQSSVGAGVVIGSNVFNLAALLGLSAVVAGRVAFRRRVVLLGGVPGVWVAAACLLTVSGVLCPWAGLVLALAVLVPYGAVLGMRRARLEALRWPARWRGWLTAAVHEEEVELTEAIRPRPGTWRDGVTAATALAAVVAASTLMEQAATTVGARYAVAGIVTGGLVLAVVTSLPNAVSAVYLARRGRGAAVLSTALNSNAINVVAGLLVPASLTGLGPRSGPGMLVAGWYAGLTVLALVLAYRGRGLTRVPGLLIIAGYLAFVSALTASVAAAGRVSWPVILIPATTIAAVAAVLLTLPLPHPPGPVPGQAGGQRRQSLVPGWTVGQMSRLGLILCVAIAACDAATGPRVILIGLLITGPCCALLTGRWVPTASISTLAVALGIALGVPDQIFATLTQYAFVGAVAAVGLTATTGAVILQRTRL